MPVSVIRSSKPVTSEKKVHTKRTSRKHLQETEKKGATTEMRKHSDYDYVEMLAKLELRIKQHESKLLEEKKKKEMSSNDLKTLGSKTSDIGGFTETLNKKLFKIPGHLKSV